MAGGLAAPSRALAPQAAAQPPPTAPGQPCQPVPAVRVWAPGAGSAATGSSSILHSQHASILSAGGAHCSRRQRVHTCAQAAAAEAAPEPATRGPRREASAQQFDLAHATGAWCMILVDAMALMYRSHYAFLNNRLRNSQGEDTTVLFGVVSTMLRLLKLKPTPTHFAVVLDAPGKTFRHELYEGYKGQRQACPTEVKEAIPRLQQLLRAMAIPVIQVPGVEADDAIGTLACRAVQQGIGVAVASPDKDFFQLLRPGLMLLRPPKKPADPGQQASKYVLVPYWQDHFEEEFGLQPEQFVDVLALAGDASDNVPGVRGIGIKTAVSLLKQFGTLENLLENAEQAKPKKAAEQLASAEGQAAARLSRQLVRIETNLELPPVQEPLDQLRLRLPADRGANLLELFEWLDFKKHRESMEELWASDLYQ